MSHFKYEIGHEQSLILKQDEEGHWYYRLTSESDALEPLDTTGTQTEALREAVSCIQDKCDDLATVVGKLVS